VAQRALDVNGITGPDPDNPLMLENRSAFFPDFGFGTVFNFSDRYSLGIAAHHLNGPSETLSETNDKRTPLSLSAHLISYFPLNFGRFDNERFVFSPGVYFRKQQYQDFIQVGMNLAYDPIFFGIWGRVSGGFKPEAAIFMVGLEMSEFRLVYNFDYKLANMRSEFPGTGSHEIVLSWKIHPPKQWRAIKCSKFSLKSMDKKKKY
jgi:type IX secretion system PorP/SprF family membrane protein